MRRFVTILLVIVAVLAVAFWYLSTPDIPRRTLEAEYAMPPSQFTDVAYASSLPGAPSSAVPARAHFRDRGPKNAPALLLLHGSNASFLTWEPWSRALSNQFRVISVDLPGHGLTGAVPNRDYSQEGMVRFVDALTHRLRLPKFALGGNSMGGGVAARYAEEHPDRLTALILVDAGGMPTKQGDKIPLAFQIARTPVLNQLVLYITPRSLAEEGLNKAILHKEIITPAMIDSYWQFARMEGTRQATLERFSVPWDTFVRDHIRAITMPTLILWGQEDGLIPVEAAHEFHKAIPRSKLIVYPKTGHIPMEEVAAQSAADVRAFLTAQTPR
jgi:pimeloyl-ACP methyl ester carboxylesterase